MPAYYVQCIVLKNQQGWHCVLLQINSAAGAVYKNAGGASVQVPAAARGPEVTPKNPKICFPLKFYSYMLLLLYVLMFWCCYICSAWSSLSCTRIEQHINSCKGSVGSGVKLHLHLLTAVSQHSCSKNAPELFWRGGIPI